MLGVYEIESGKITYVGNKQFDRVADISAIEFLPAPSSEILERLANSEHYYHLHRIDSTVFNATVDYFRKINTSWCNLPLTTKMISSPGEVYAGKKLDYTSDALPVSLKWFDKEEIFLAESSQFYLEMRLLIDRVDRVFSIYNSFRKEPADFSHLSEFQHIEFEGLISFEENIEIYIGLLRSMTQAVLLKCKEDLEYYLTDVEITELASSFDNSNIETISFNDAMNLLLKELGDKKYEEVSLKNFGSYEEIALTRIVGKHCNVVEFPLEEIPFYHDVSFTNKQGKQFAKNADFILMGYREVIGSGQRITSPEAIKKKASFFNLPMVDYEPYIQLRDMKKYQSSCGFGLGWQRYTQWLLKLPYIWDASHIPRGHFTPRP